MSFLKFWGKKDKKDVDDAKIDETADPELGKKRLRHTLSISRSGRFKQKKRERGQILDKPEIFNDAPSQQQTMESRVAMTTTPNHGSQFATSSTSTTKPAHKSSPQNTCRDANSMGRSRLRMGQSVAT